MTHPTDLEPIAIIDEVFPLTEPGYLQVKGEGKMKLPLAGLHVQGQVLGAVIDVEMKQRFQNNYDNPLEAVYIFPLPGAAAVYHFELKVGERIVSGAVQERQAARQAYQAALDQGHRAAMMEQERDDVYSLQVGNIPAGESVEICLNYVQQLDYREQGLYECRIPTVVAPRYIPGQITDFQSGLGIEADTDLVPDASRISPPRLAPGFDPKTDLSIEVSLDMTQGLSDLACTQHASQTTFETGRVLVKLAQQERLNRDFVLRWRAFQAVNESELSAQLYYVSAPEGSEDEGLGGFGMLQLQAPAPAFLQDQHRDIVFLLDRSGSMGEYKMAAASQACDRLLNSLGPGDRFAIQAFDHEVEWLHPQGQEVWIPADQQGKDKGRKYLRSLESRGGTELFTAIRQALAHFETTEACLPVMVLLTDGQVGDESRILKEIQAQLGKTLVHTIGIDTALNEAFLQRLSRLGGGSHVSVAPREDLNQVLEGIASEIGYPALQDMRLNLPQLTPDPIPNLYLGRSLTLFFAGECPAEVAFEAQRNGQSEKISVQVQKRDFPALARLWAHSRIQSLEDQFRLADSGQKQSLKEQMIEISCAHQVLCRMTAWLAVDKAATIQNAEDRQTVVQPLEMPADWAAPLAVSGPRSMSSRYASFATMSAPMDALAEGVPEMMPFEVMTDMMPQTVRAEPMAPSSPPAPIPAPPGRHQAGGGPSGGHGLLQNMLKKQSKKALKKKMVPEDDVRSTGISGDLQLAIHDFLDALKAVLEALAKQESPDWKSLKQAHTALSEGLQKSDQSEYLPALQRLLRQESRQLLQALESGHLSGIHILTSRCQTQLQKVQEQQRPVWEQSI